MSCALWQLRLVYADPRHPASGPAPLPHPLPALPKRAPGSRSARHWRLFGRLPWPATATTGQHASVPAQQQGVSWQAARPLRPCRFSPHMLIRLSQQTKRCMDLTERAMEQVQEACPDQVDAAQLSLITRHIAEGRRRAEEIELLAQNPSQDQGEAVNYAISIRDHCIDWAADAVEQVEQNIQLQAAQLGMEPFSFPPPPQRPRSGPKPPAS
ncbi:hypothetical protein ABPG77_004597 [Micractinium sp. CCAP 211/92]